MFGAHGFSQDTTRYRACGVAYHPSCIQVGEPFQTRRDDGRGLTFPKVSGPLAFICEACTVRSVLGRELTEPSDVQLMALERMRLLDLAHSWAPGSYDTYRPYLRAVQSFQNRWDIPILRIPQLQAPPNDPIIPLMWCHEVYGLREGRGFQPGTRNRARVAFATVRQLRSAVAQWEAWTWMVTSPMGGHFDQSKRLLQGPCRPTDSATFALFAKGLASRTGTESKPSKALLLRQVASLDQFLHHRFSQETDPEQLRELSLAGLFNLVLWLGWLRSSEGLGLRWGDLDITLPSNGPQLDLPTNVGAVRLRLRPETKSNRSSRADMILAYRSASGLQLGKWAQRALQWSSPGYLSEAVFQHPDKAPWTSAYFREHYLYPSLHRQRAQGDPYLLPFSGGYGPTLEEAFWGLGSYRNGARSSVSRKRIHEGNHLRKATETEVYEHARWRRGRHNEAIDKVYQQWTWSDRLAITKCCM